MIDKQANLTSGRRLARNVVWNFLGTGVPLLVAIVAIPVLIDGLGTARFGVLTFAWMVVGYFSHAQIDRIDLYLGKFSKLQDFITSKLFRFVALASLEDTSQDISLIDTLRRMEKYDIVHDFDDWFGDQTAQKLSHT